MWKIVSCKVQCFVLILQKRQISRVKVEVIWTSKINNNFLNRHFFPFLLLIHDKKNKRASQDLNTIDVLQIAAAFFLKLIMFWKIIFANTQLTVFSWKKCCQSWRQAYLSEYIWMQLWLGLSKVFWSPKHVKNCSLPSFFGHNCLWQGRWTSHILGEPCWVVAPLLSLCLLKGKAEGNNYLRPGQLKVWWNNADPFSSLHKEISAEQIGQMHSFLVLLLGC